MPYFSTENIETGKNNFDELTMLNLSFKECINQFYTYKILSSNRWYMYFEVLFAVSLTAEKEGCTLIYQY